MTEQIRALASGLPRGARLPRVRALCVQYGVSSVTLGRVLQDLQHEGVVARRPRAGVYAGPATSQATVGIVIGHNIFAPGFSPYWAMQLHAAFRVAGEFGIRCFSYMDMPTGANQSAGIMEWPGHAQLVRDMGDGVLDGLLIVNEPELPLLRQLRAGSLPLVELTGNDSIGYRVAPDTRSMLNDAVGALFAAGCRRMALLNVVAEPEAALFGAALRNRDLRVAPRLLWTYADWAARIAHTTREDWAAQLVSARWETLGLVNARPDGIVILDDTMARGAIRALETRHVEVGRDVRLAVMATPHSPVLAGYEDRLILLQLDPEVVARVGYEMLVQLMAGREIVTRNSLVRVRVDVPG